ncbi:MAG TPA: aromatic ring-hydroxylating dioxygenase subunit alpha [Chthoniobacterales bacterium]|nr:aromatic ring-hydroxylating dioxygenase subunit alpha [Chthoniobacterales bacterium]
MQSATMGKTPVYRKTTESFRTGATTLPQRYFISPEVFAEEREKIFARQWVCVGHQGQLVRPGDFLVREVAGESIVVVRDRKELVRAFYNVCRHRGTRLCEAASGHAAAIQCPYHAWTYALDGRLVGAPHMDAVPGFEKADYGLHVVNLQIWEGFIFVSLAEKPRPLEEVFAPLAGKFTEWNLPLLRSARRIVYDVQANWKLIFENYSECYHCPGVHPALAKVSPYDSAENDLCQGPFLGGFMKIAKGASLTMSGNACARPVGEIRGEDHHRVFYYSIFPNLLLSLHPDYVMVHQLWPQSPERTLIECDWYFHPEAAAGVDAPGYDPDDAVAFWDMTNRQDWHVCELSQKGISSQAYQPGPYSPRESIPAAWDREYLAVMSA